jgi:tRNA(adenine34) deaminase
VSAFVRPGDERWMREALLQATLAAADGDVPVGACVVADGDLIAVGHNAMRRDNDATQHAELRALQAAMLVRRSDRLMGCTLYVTLEPCAMCAGALVLSRVDRVVFAAWDEKAGMAGSISDLLRHPRLNHRPEVSGGILETESRALLQQFFATRRDALGVVASVDPSAQGA